MANNDAEMIVSLNGEDFALTRHNTTLYSFWGRVTIKDYELDASTFNHIYVQTSDTYDESENKGGYLFSTNPAYKKIAKFAIKNYFPYIAYMTEVPEIDIKSWEKITFEDLNSAIRIPDGWVWD